MRIFFFKYSGLSRIISHLITDCAFLLILFINHFLQSIKTAYYPKYCIGKMIKQENFDAPAAPAGRIQRRINHRTIHLNRLSARRSPDKVAGQPASAGAAKI